jgi:uncharacterized phage infection (PIP) family protein YhgE
MSDKSKKAAIDLAALTKKYNTAAKKVANLPENVTEEDRQKAVDAVNKALEALNDGKKLLLVEVKFLKTPTGKFNLGYTKGDKGQVSLLLAEVMEEEGYCSIKGKIESLGTSEEADEEEGDEEEGDEEEGDEEAQSIEVTDPKEETGKEE